MIHAFLGYERRESVGFHVFVSSLIERASVPVAIHPLNSKGLPEGTNSFTFSRFLTPWLMGFKGHALFMDASDMLMLGDVAELVALFDPAKSVQCVKHDYKTRNPIKYIGTEMECPNMDYPRKNWASVMLINCEHPAWRDMTPARIREFATVPTHLLGLRWIEDGEIGFLPDEWNRLVDEGEPVEGAKVLHWTAGIPGFAHYRNALGSDLWHRQAADLKEVA